MGLSYRKRVKLGKTASVNISKTGVSLSKRFGPITLNSRGQVTLRLAPGFTYRLF